MAFGSNADSGLVFGSPNTTELWNGTSWTEVNDQSTGKKAVSYTHLTLPTIYSV